MVEGDKVGMPVHEHHHLDLLAGSISPALAAAAVAV